MNWSILTQVGEVPETAELGDGDEDDDPDEDSSQERRQAFIEKLPINEEI